MDHDIEPEEVLASSSEDDHEKFILRIVTDEDAYGFAISDIATARALLASVSKLRTWIERSSGTPHEREGKPK